jgi:hypothetical protein
MKPHRWYTHRPRKPMLGRCPPPFRGLCLYMTKIRFSFRCLGSSRSLIEADTQPRVLSWNKSLRDLFHINIHPFVASFDHGSVPPKSLTIQQPIYVNITMATGDITLHALFSPSSLSLEIGLQIAIVGVYYISVDSR